MLELLDKIPEGVHTIFVGINPAIRSAEVGHYYAHPSNMFWQLVRSSGLSPPGAVDVNDDFLVKLGFGFTDVAKRPTARASQLQDHEFCDARQRMVELCQKHRPKVLVFVSKTAARAFEQGDYVRYGPQPGKFLGATVWFLPSTSGQSRGDSDYLEKHGEFTRLANWLKNNVLCVASTKLPVEENVQEGAEWLHRVEQRRMMGLPPLPTEVADGCAEGHSRKADCDAEERGEP